MLDFEVGERYNIGDLISLWHISLMSVMLRHLDRRVGIDCMPACNSKLREGPLFPIFVNSKWK